MIALIVSPMVHRAARACPATPEGGKTARPWGANPATPKGEGALALRPATPEGGGRGMGRLAAPEGGEVANGIMPLEIITLDAARDDAGRGFGGRRLRSGTFVSEILRSTWLCSGVAVFSNRRGFARIRALQRCRVHVGIATRVFQSDAVMDGCPRRDYYAPLYHASLSLGARSKFREHRSRDLGHAHSA